MSWTAAAGGERLRRVGQHARRRRLVGDEGPHEVGVRSDEGERVDGPAAAGEQVDRACADGLDHRAHVGGVDLGGHLEVGVRALAALDAARVVRDDGAVGEVGRQRGEAGGTHRRADHHEHRPAGGLALADVVAQHGAGHVQLVGHGFGHRILLRLSPISTGFAGRTHRAGSASAACGAERPARLLGHGAAAATGDHRLRRPFALPQRGDQVHGVVEAGRWSAWRRTRSAAAR